MHPVMSSVFQPSLPDHCEPSGWFLTQFSRTFHTCVPTPLALISTTLGCLSIASWLFAQMPQIYKNWQLRSTSGLSIYFLAEWLLGDLTNLLGCVFTEQATWQIVLATYYCTVDVMLCAQWVWYEHLKHGREWRQAGSISDTLESRPNTHGERDDRPEMIRSPSKPIQLPTRSMFRMPKFSFSPSSLLKADEQPAENASPGRRTINRSGQGASFMGVSPRTMLYATTIVAVLANSAQASPTQSDKGLFIITNSSEETPLQIAGRLLSWCSTFLYLGSRLPQLYKNHTRKSTSGLSPHLFIAAFFGNLFYSSSILTNPCAWSDFPPYGGGGWADEHGSDQAIWLSKAIPFWLGAAGVLIMDAAVGVQFLMYGQARDGLGSSKPIIIVDEQNADGRHVQRTWRRASGWMRGWYPSSVAIAGTPRPGTPRSLLSADGYFDGAPGSERRRDTNVGAEAARWEERQRLLAGGDGGTGSTYGSV